MGILTDKINELDRLEKQYRTERERIEQAIADTVRSIGQNPVIKPLGLRMFTIPLSELITPPLVSGVSRLDGPSGTFIEYTE